MVINEIYRYCRKIDDLGRMVTPIELKKTMNINKKDSMEVFVDGDKIILRKYEPACIFCASADDVIEFESRTICGSCQKKLQKNKITPYDLK